MDLHELPFAKIIIIQDDIAEIMVNEGIEMNASMVEQYHEFLLSHLKPPFSLLVNKINSYTYDFDAQTKIGTIKEINVMAVVAYNRVTKIATETLAAYPRSEEWKLKIFSNRDAAIDWLILEQNNLANK